MSLSTGLGYGAAGGAGGVLHYQPAPQQFRAPGGDQAGAAGPSLGQPGGGRGVAASGLGDSRGALTGDRCITLAWNHGSQCLDVAVWDEERSECEQVPSQSALVSVTAAGAAKLASLPPTKTSLDALPEGVATVNGSDGAEIVVRALDEYSTGAQKTTAHGCTIDPALLLSHAVLKSVEVGAATAEAGAQQQQQQQGKKKKSKSKAVNPLGRGITVVLPCSYSYEQSFRVAKLLQGAGLTVKNIFNSGIAAVAFQLVMTRISLDLANKDEALLVAYVSLDKAAGRAESCLVRCELRSLPGQSKSGSKEVSRLSCLAVGQGNDVASALADLGAASSSGEIRVIVCGGADATAAAAETKGRKGVEEVIKASAGDAVKGGCFLSAAELDSSKQYLQQGDGTWTVMYQLPVGDGLLVADVALRVQQSEKDPGTTEEVFSAGTKLVKRDVGATSAKLALEPAPAVVKRDFKCKGPDDAGLWPKVTVLCRAARSSSSEWRECDVVLPLAAQGSGSGGVETSVLVLALDPATGLARPAVQRGRLLSTLRQTRQFWFKTILYILGTVLVAAGIKGALVWSEHRDVQNKVDWLSEFYREHAPEKLENMTHIRLAVNRYKGKLWVLQRSLEDKYKVKMKRDAPEEL